jgi:hypothetical protein
MTDLTGKLTLEQMRGALRIKTACERYDLARSTINDGINSDQIDYFTDASGVKRVTAESLEHWLQGRGRRVLRGAAAHSAAAAEAELRPRKAPDVPTQTIERHALGVRQAAVHPAKAARRAGALPGPNSGPGLCAVGANKDGGRKLTGPKM